MSSHVLSFSGAHIDVYSGGKGRGAVDMGGESKQIAFALSADEIQGSNSFSGLVGEASTDKDVAIDFSHCKPQWLVKFPRYSEIQLFTRSYNGFGIIAAMNLIARIPHASHKENLAIPSSEQNNDNDMDSDMDSVEFSSNGDTLDKASSSLSSVSSLSSGKTHISPSAVGRVGYHHPCYAPGIFPPGEAHDLEYDLNGAGNFSACIEMIRSALGPEIPTSDLQCIQVRFSSDE